MELIFNLITLIKELNEHVNDYKCDDQMIDSVLRKITNINPQLENFSSNLEDPVINANCKELFEIIIKIKSNIKEYNSKSKFRKFVNIRDLKKSIEEFDKDINCIFRNLKLNTIIDSSKTITNLKNHIEDDVQINKELLDMKRNSIKLKKDSISEIEHINDKIRILQNKIDNLQSIKNVDVSDLFNNVYEFEDKYNLSLNNLNDNIVKMQNTIINLKEKLQYLKNFEDIYNKIEDQNKKIKYQDSFKKYFLNFIIEQFFYYFFFILFYIISSWSINDKIYT